MVEGILPEKKGYVLPKTEVLSSHQLRIFNSDGVQSVVRPTKSPRKRSMLREAKRDTLKKNLWKSLNVILRLNPYAKTAKGMALLDEPKQLSRGMVQLRLSFYLMQHPLEVV